MFPRLFPVAYLRKLHGIVLVNQSAGGEFIPDKVVQPDEECDPITELGLLAIDPGLSKVDAVNRHQNVDSDGRAPELIKISFTRKIARRHPLKRSSKGGECREDSLRILCRRLNPNIKVFGMAGLAIQHDRVAADDEVLNLEVFEILQKIAEVGVHRDLLV